MKTARELFENARYILRDNCNSSVIYSSIIPKSGIDKEVTFYKYAGIVILKNHEALVKLDIKELSAILQQCKELEWLEQSGKEKDENNE